MTDYMNLSAAGAALALQEFLDERGPALEHLRDSLVADGRDPDVLLAQRGVCGFCGRGLSRS